MSGGFYFPIPHPSSPPQICISLDATVSQMPKCWKYGSKLCMRQVGHVGELTTRFHPHNTTLSNVHRGVRRRPIPAPAEEKKALDINS